MGFNFLLFLHAQGKIHVLTEKAETNQILHWQKSRNCRLLLDHQCEF